MDAIILIPKFPDLFFADGGVLVCEIEMLSQGNLFMVDNIMGQGDQEGRNQQRGIAGKRQKYSPNFGKIYKELSGFIACNKPFFPVVSLKQNKRRFCLKGILVSDKERVVFALPRFKEIVTLKISFEGR